MYVQKISLWRKIIIEKTIKYLKELLGSLFQQKEINLDYIACLNLSYIMTVSCKLDSRRKHLTCRKSLTNFNTFRCIKYTWPEL